MNSLFRRVIGLFVATLVFAGVSAGFATSAIAQLPDEAEPVKHCVTLLTKPDPTKRDTEVVSQTCSTDGSRVAAPAAATLLMTAWGEEDYLGSFNDLYGDFGTCDSAGYGFNNFDGVNASINGMESYQLFGNCTAAEYYTGTNASGTGSGIIPGQFISILVPTSFLNNVRSMYVFQF